MWRTVDAGKTWQKVGPELKKPLLFRDVEAVDADTAQILAIGPGRQSRIYRTTDGGATWDRTFTNKDQDAFYDCMAMFPDGVHGLAMSDPVRGKFRIIRTEDGGLTWSEVSRKGMPPAVDGEFGFAASGTCLVTAGDSDAYFATGGGGQPDLLVEGLRHHLGGRQEPDPRCRGRRGLLAGVQGEARGHRRGRRLHRPRQRAPDVGVRLAQAWKSGGDLGGYRSGVAWLPGEKPVAVAVGPTGSDITHDGGRTWTTFDADSFDAVMCATDGTCWASGADGAVAILRR